MFLSVVLQHNTARLEDGLDVGCIEGCDLAAILHGESGGDSCGFARCHTDDHNAVGGVRSVGARDASSCGQDIVRAFGDDRAEGDIVGLSGVRVSLRLTAACGIMDVD